MLKEIKTSAGLQRWSSSCQTGNVTSCRKHKHSICQQGLFTWGRQHWDGPGPERLMDFTRSRWEGCYYGPAILTQLLPPTFLLESCKKKVLATKKKFINHGSLTQRFMVTGSEYNRINSEKKKQLKLLSCCFGF